MALLRPAAGAYRRLLLEQSHVLRGGWPGAAEVSLIEQLNGCAASQPAWQLVQQQAWHRGDSGWRRFHVQPPLQHVMPQPTSSNEEDKDGKAGYATQASSATEPKHAAQLCDEAINYLQAVRSKGERQSRFGPPTWGQRANDALRAALQGLKVTILFVSSIPGKISGFLALSSAERREVYKGWWAYLKKEAYHYWVGTKLLGTDIKIASRLVAKAVKGKQLTRRERKQLTRTTADVFRLVPFAVFVLVPFMEVLLPVALRLFPNMLPSTFEDKLKKEEELKKRVAVKLEVARFLQDTVQEMAKDIKTKKTGASQASAAELYAFMKRVRAGEAVSQYEIMRFAALFNDELTLDNLERIHLVNLCRFVGIQPFGTDAFLVARLRSHLNQIKADDRAIKDEGLDALSEEELRAACRARGMRAPYGEGATAFMRRQLAEWLDLSLNRALPSSLLLLSRAFTVTQPVEKPAAAYESLKDTLGALPNKVITEVSMESAGGEDDTTESYERKLEQLKREEELIHEEETEAAALLRAEPPPLRPGQDAQAAMTAAAASAVVREAAAAAVRDVLEGESAEEKASKAAEAREEKMRKVISALAALATSSGVSTERAAFMGLVQAEVARLHDVYHPRGAPHMVFSKGGVAVERPPERVEVVGQKRLADKVTGILARIERELDAVEARIGESMHVLDADNDGLVTREELRIAMSFLKDQLGEGELRALLGRLNAFQPDGETPIDVASLLALAAGAPSSGEGAAESKAVSLPKQHAMAAAKA